MLVSASQSDSDADAITPPDPGVMLEGVPAHLAGPLRQWIDEALDDAAWGGRAKVKKAKKLCVQLHVIADENDYLTAVKELPDDQLLKAIQVLLTRGIVGTTGVPELNRLLRDGHSVYEVFTPTIFGRPRLRRRMDGFLRKIFDRATTTPDQVAAKHLATAYAAAYDGFVPDPTKAYSEAVKAVEAILCPLVSPKADGDRTLGKAISDLRNQLKATTPTWTLGMPGKTDQPASLEKLIAMLDLLMEGQRSRHAGSSNSRPQTVEEAIWAVTLATAIVHLVKTGMLTKRS